MYYFLCSTIIFFLLVNYSCLSLCLPLISGHLLEHIFLVAVLSLEVEGWNSPPFSCFLLFTVILAFPVGGVAMYKMYHISFAVPLCRGCSSVTVWLITGHLA